MIAAVWGFLTSPVGKFAAIAAALALVAVGVTVVLDTTFNRGETAGKADVTNAVQSKTIETIDKAQKSKDAADEAVRNSPYADNVDSLR